MKNNIKNLKRIIMYRQFISQKKATSLGFAAFLIGLSIISINRTWWPDIMIVVGVALGLKNFLLRKFYDAGLVLFIFLGVFLSEKFASENSYFLPVLLITSSMFVLVREYVESKLLPEDQKEEDLNHEIEESKKD